MHLCFSWCFPLLKTVYLIGHRDTSHCPYTYIYIHIHIKLLPSWGFELFFLGVYISLVISQDITSCETFSREAFYPFWNLKVNLEPNPTSLFFFIIDKLVTCKDKWWWFRWDARWDLSHLYNWYVVGLGFFVDNSFPVSFSGEGIHEWTFIVFYTDSQRFDALVWLQW